MPARASPSAASAQPANRAITGAPRRCARRAGPRRRVRTARAEWACRSGRARRASMGNRRGRRGSMRRDTRTPRGQAFSMNLTQWSGTVDSLHDRRCVRWRLRRRRDCGCAGGAWRGNRGLTRPLVAMTRQARIQAITRSWRKPMARIGRRALARLISASIWL